MGTASFSAVISLKVGWCREWLIWGLYHHTPYLWILRPWSAYSRFLTDVCFVCEVHRRWLPTMHSYREHASRIFYYTLENFSREGAKTLPWRKTLRCVAISASSKARSCLEFPQETHRVSNGFAFRLQHNFISLMLLLAYLAHLHYLNIDILIRSSFIFYFVKSQPLEFPQQAEKEQQISSMLLRGPRSSLESDEWHGCMLIKLSTCMHNYSMSEIPLEL